MFARGRILTGTFLFLLIGLCTAPLARAAESYLDVVPSTALAWGVVNHMDAASEKVQELAKVVQAPVANLLETTKKESGLEKGLDDKGAVGFFAMPGKSEKDLSTASIFVAVTDEKEFLGNFEVVKESGKIYELKAKTPGGGSLVMAFLHGYAVLSPKSDRVAVEAAVEAKQSIATEMAGYESWLAENDASIVGTAAGIKYAAKQVQDEMKKSGGDAGMPAEMAQLMGSFRKVFGTALETAPKELSLVSAGIRCDKQSALRIIARARLIQGGEVAKSVAQIPPVNENLLSSVPGGPFVFAMAGVGVPGLLDSYANLSANLMKSMKSLYGMSGDDLERMSKESFEAFRQVRSMAFVWKLGKRNDPLYSNMYGTMKVDDSQRLLNAQKKYAQTADKLMQNSKNGMLKSMAVKPITIAGKPALQQEMTFDFSSFPGTEASRGMLDQMMGVGGKMVLYNVAADEHTVVMGIGVPQERMTTALEVLKQPKRSLAEDADIAVTAGMLPEKSQWVVYVSFRGYSQVIIRTMTMALKATPGAQNFSFPAFPKSPPLGLAVKATSDEIHAEIAVPQALVQATGEYVKEFQAAIMNQMMERNHPPAP